MNVKKAQKNRPVRTQDGYNFIVEKVMDYRVAKIILVANYYDLFTLIEQGNTDVVKLCDKMRTDVRATQLLLNALVSVELLQKTDNEYGNTDLAREYLVSSSSKYMGDNLKYQELVWDCWTELKDVVKTGTPSICLEELLSKQDLHFVRDYIYGMENIARMPAEAIAEHLDLSGMRKMLDVGGGSGAYSRYFAKLNPNLEIHILDLPRTLSITREIISKSNLKDRTRFIEGDYVSSPFGHGYDLVLISHVTHNEGDQVNQLLINKSFEALNPGGILIVHDFLIDDCKTKPRFPALFAINMLVYTNQGRTYSWEEYVTWLERAGFSNLHRVDILENLDNRSSLLFAEKRLAAAR